jgi:uncharacterized Tic20 family protein
MMGVNSKSARNWAAACHLAAFSGWIFPVVGWVLGPLIVWLLKRHDHGFVDYHGKESLNFQISLIIYAFIAGLLCFVLIGFALLLVLAVLQIVLVVLASIKASDGKYYRYPLTIRFIS